MKKTLMVWLLIGLYVITLASCTYKPAVTASQSPSASPSPSPSAASETVLIGMVTAIEGDEITMALSAKSPASSAGAPSPAPSGTPKPSAPPDATSSATQKLSPSGTSVEITVTPKTVITLSNNGKTEPGALKDITLGDILYVTISGNTVKAITVAGFGISISIPGQPGSGQPSDGTSGATASSGGQYDSSGSDATSGATVPSGSQSGSGQPSDATSGATVPSGSQSGSGQPSDATSGATVPSGNQSSSPSYGEHGDDEHEEDDG